MKAELDEFCPCCGYNTYEGEIEDRLNWLICPICGWEDDPVQFENPNYEGGPNGVSLIQGQKNFEKFGASKIERVKSVQKPNKGDIRKPNWSVL